MEKQDQDNSSPGLYRFCVQIPIRYADIDAQRHLNNVAYFTFMEHARVEYMRQTGLWDGRDFGTVGMILAETSCTYKAPAYLGQTVSVWCRVSYLGRKSFTFDYSIRTEEGEIATGRSIQVCYDYSEERTIVMPAAWRNAIQDYEPGLDREPNT
ncbi:MAG: thioesterase family protein [Anaerolineae bacterium]|jgi:acyl-CoA thioester hydrolase